MFELYVGCAVVGALAVSARFITYFRVSLNTKAFVQYIDKLVTAGNPERAVKLCSAAPHAPIAAITKAMLELYIAGAGPDDLQTLFRAMYTKTAVRFAQGALLTNMALGLSAVLLALPSEETGISLGPSLIAPAILATVSGLLVLSFRRLRKDIYAAGEPLVAAMSKRS